jgi:eukaryotic-like serine/threonine-protein kinase
VTNEDDKTGKTQLPTVDEINSILSQPIRDPLVGTKLAGGRYEILEVLGEGGMSVVYKAKQELVDRIVAIKTLKMQLLSDPMLIKRFDREVKTLSRLNHPNIVTVYDCIVSETGQPYFVMDYLQGYSLQDLLSSEGRINAGRARNIFSQVCNAVEHAHRNGIVHRDLKPANIMLMDISGQEFVKVVDFGLAKIGEDAQRLTQTGEIWGSPFYMSPEQCNGVSMDGRSDIYSLGACLFEALTGSVPFRGTSFLDTISKVVAIAPPSFAEVAPDAFLPAGVEAIVLRALAKSPDQRYQTMEEMRDVIERVFPIEDFETKPSAGKIFVVDKASASTPTRELTRNIDSAAATKRMGKSDPKPAKAPIVSAPTSSSPSPSKAMAGKVSAKKSESSSSNTLLAAVIGGLIAALAVIAVNLINNQQNPAPAVAPTVAPAVPPAQATLPVAKPATSHGQSPSASSIVPTGVQNKRTPPPDPTLTTPDNPLTPKSATESASVSAKSAPFSAAPAAVARIKPLQAMQAKLDLQQVAKPAVKPHTHVKIRPVTSSRPAVSRPQSHHQQDDTDVWESIRKY